MKTSREKIMKANEIFHEGEWVQFEGNSWVDSGVYRIKEITLLNFKKEDEETNSLKEKSPIFEFVLETPCRSYKTMTEYPINDVKLEKLSEKDIAEYKNVNKTY